MCEQEEEEKAALKKVTINYSCGKGFQRTNENLRQNDKKF